MIGKHVSCKPENDSYGRLARYIADAGHDGEKCLVSWSTGCWSGDDYDLGILEAEAVQDLNTRSSKEKTYHLLVSFRPEDEAKLTLEAFKSIEERLAQALGFSEHQRAALWGSQEHQQSPSAHCLQHDPPGTIDPA